MYSIVLKIKTLMVHSYASVEKKYEGDTLRFECTMCICSKDWGCSEDWSNTVPFIIFASWQKNYTKQCTDHWQSTDHQQLVQGGEKRYEPLIYSVTEPED